MFAVAIDVSGEVAVALELVVAPAVAVAVAVHAAVALAIVIAIDVAVAAALAVVAALAVLVAVAVVVAVAVGELVLYYLQFCMESIAGISMIFPYPCISYQLLSTSMVRSSFSKVPDIFSVKLARSAAAYQDKWHGNWWKKSEKKKNGFSS